MQINILVKIINKYEQNIRKYIVIFPITRTIDFIIFNKLISNKSYKYVFINRW